MIQTSFAGTDRLIAYERIHGDYRVRDSSLSGLTSSLCREAWVIWEEDGRLEQVTAQFSEEADDIFPGNSRWVDEN